MSARALIIDDEPDILSLLSITLERMDIKTDTAEDVATAKSLIDTNHYDFCLSDMRLPDGDGMELVSYVQEKAPQMPIAIITAHGNMELGIESMKLGAFDFVSKPVDLSRLRTLVKSALKLSGDQPTEKSITEKQLIGTSDVMVQLRQTIEKLARSQAPVYISGESGTGKELVAQLIHRLGGRQAGPFIPVNCSAIPKELMESEFFGHLKGSFTGAVSDKKGLFASADGGTLFLDEIADLPLDMQVKLLRAIQEQAIRPIGSDTESSVNVRILSATHKNLAELVTAGDFRQDLFYRVNVIEVKVPPLRKRPEDIPLLSDFLLTKLQHGEQNIVLSQDALSKLSNYQFPGNVRELENILERAITLNTAGAIEADDIQVSTVTSVPETTSEVITEDIPTRGDKPLEDYLQGIERDAIKEALEACRWNKTAAAKKLGISFRALRYKLQKLDLE